MPKQFAIGADIGGSHISCAACNMNEQKFLPETFSESHLDNKAGAAEIIKIWSKTLEKTIHVVGLENIAGIGFAMPGPFDYENGIALFPKEINKYEKLYGLNISEALRKEVNLPDNFPVRFVNDAVAFALGEDWIGKTRDCGRSLALTLGTGFGSSFLANSIPVVTGETVPKHGYVWHLPMEGGIADDYFSTRGLVARYIEKSKKQVSGAKEIADAALTDEIAKAIFEDLGSKLVVLLKPWLQKFGVEVLVVGGNISNAFELFAPAMKNQLQTEGLNIRIEFSELLETASIIGSARLAEPEFWNRIAPVIKDLN